MGIPNPLIRIRLDSQPRAARASTAVTVDSRAVADAFFYRWGIEARVVYPGVDLESFGPSAPRHAAPVVFCPAQVEVARKRVNLLLDALPLLRERWPDAVLLLMKPSDEAAEAELRRAHEGLEFFDPVEDAGQLAELYARAWVTALPSYGEAFGMVLIESLACGTPVVAARRDAAPEIVASDDVGRLFDDSRPGTLTEALIEAIELARRPETATACRARAGVFSSARTVDAFESLYSELLG
jgi:glycosyltransferase involved in cell wall biosynthesis